MSARKTTTGGVLEKMVLHALKHGGYTHQSQVRIGRRPGGGSHVVDVVATDGKGRRYLVSLKWQQTSGTAEQKVPFEAICLADVIANRPSEFHAAYIVLGGDGWTLRNFYVGGGLTKHLTHGRVVKIVTLEAFVAAANSGKL